MKLFLAGSGWGERLWIPKNDFDFYRLESFHCISKKEEPFINNYKGFLLDSGAFTFMNSQKSIDINWDNYITKYADFIIKNNVLNFFELDIDSLVGIEKVEELRNTLERKTGRQSIPVWHKSRGLDYWIGMCREYDYVAIGGIVTKEIKASEHSVFSKLLRIAKENNCKVHGLGYTNLKGVKKYPFYSVDSTSWLSGNRFGAVYRFRNGTLIKTNKPKGMRVITQRTAENNFQEWVKFQKFLDKKL